MDNISQKKIRPVLNLIYITMIFSLIHLLGSSMNMKINIIWEILWISSLSLGIKFFIFHPIIFYIIMTAVLIGSFIVQRYISPVLVNFFERMVDLFVNILNNLQGLEPISDGNMLPYYILLIILSAFMTGLLLFKRRSSALIALIYMTVFLFYWYDYYDKAYPMMAIFLTAFLLLIGMNKYLKEYSSAEKQSTKSMDRIYSPWLKTAFIYSTLIVGIALVLPKGYCTIQWQWMQRFIYTNFPIVEELRSYGINNRETGEAGIFNFSMTGIDSGNRALGGPVLLNDKVIMSVRADETTYLRGNVKHHYTGTHWEGSDHYIAYPLESDISNLSEMEKNLYYEEKFVSILYTSFSSQTMFTPYRPAKISFENEGQLMVGLDSQIQFTGGVYDKENYYVTYYEPRSYGLIKDLFQENSHSDRLLSSHYSPIPGQEHPNVNIPDIYLQIPEGVKTPETYQLLEEITNGYVSTYDKAYAIEKHLRENYNYNLEVDFIPEGRDFVDYFLSESKEGYCTYFASAMAVLLRMEGIPSRYVEGYIAKDEIQPNIYEVTNRNAHAWVEAFIQPVGWIRFEPTPAYSTENILHRDDISEPEYIGTDTAGPREDNPTDRRLRPEDILDEANLGNLLPETLEDGIPEEAVQRGLIEILSIIVLIFLSLRVIAGLIQYNLKKRRIKKLSVNNRIISLYQEIVVLMGYLGFQIKPGETHSEFASRVAYKFHSYDDIGIKGITQIFIRSKYSTMAATEDDLNQLIKYRDKVDNLLRKYWGKRLYYYRKYIRNIL